jgi:hypothetical protein
VAVTLTLLRSDPGPLAGALAGALLLGQRYNAVLTFILDRRVQRSGPFGRDFTGPEPPARGGPAAAAEERARRQGLAGPEQELADQLWPRQRVRLVVRRQAPFGF